MENRHIDHICTQLKKMDEGMILLGISSPILREATATIKSQADALDAYRRQDGYKAGYNDGWNAAFGNVLPGDKEDE